jgi:dTDP-4-amino-4,6-dideoxygalactose transaminase
MIPHSRPTTGDEEAAAAAAAVRSGLLVDGPHTAQFEREVARQTGAAWGVSVSSGTTALHLALLSLGIGPADRVALPSYVCVALLHAVRYVQAEPVIVDVDPATMNIDPDALKQAAPARLKAVIVPHMFGLSAPLDAVAALGAPVIEDCAHAIGATFQGRPVGGQGCLGICSFYATKMMTTGEGGMIVGHDPVQEERLRNRRDYDQPDAAVLRFNYKLTEMQAAMGCVQLERLPAFLARRRQIAERYHAGLSGLDAGLPGDRPGAPHAYYRYVLSISSRRRLPALIDRLEQEGVACRRPVTRPIHQLAGRFSCPGADAVFDRALSVPIYPSLSDEECERVIKALRRVLE